MKKQQTFQPRLLQIAACSFLAMGIIALGATLSQFEGLIQIKLGLDGGQMMIDSRPAQQVK